MTCWLAQFSEKPCSVWPAQLDPVHLVSKQVLKRAGIENIWDKRWLVPGCRYHHACFDNHKLKVPREAVPEALEALCKQVGLLHALDRRFGEVVDTATIVND